MTDRRTSPFRGLDGLVARPVLDSDDLEVLTVRRTVDPRTAMARALEDYLGEARFVQDGGREVRFESTSIDWEQPEVPQVNPALCVVGTGAGTYDASRMSPGTVAVDVGEGRRRYLRAVSEVQQAFSLLVWTTDPVHRSGLVVLLEDMLDPTDFMYGVRLEMPYYFGARATFEKRSVLFEDSSTEAHRGRRAAVIQVVGSAPEYRPVGELPLMRPRNVVEVEDS